MTRITGSDQIAPGSIRIIPPGMTGRSPDRIGLVPLGAIRNPVHRSAPDQCAVKEPARRAVAGAFPFKRLVVSIVMGGNRSRSGSFCGISTGRGGRGARSKTILELRHRTAVLTYIRSIPRFLIFLKLFTDGLLGDLRKVSNAFYPPKLEGERHGMVCVQYWAD